MAELQPEAEAARAKSLEDLGYRYDDAGRLVTLAEPHRGFVFTTQAAYEELGRAVVAEVQRRLVADAGLVEHTLPGNVPVFVSQGLLSQAKQLEAPLLFLICGTGAVQAGQIARALCINETLSRGTLLPDVAEARKRGWDVAVLNPNHGGRPPLQHAEDAWEAFAAHNNRRVGIFAHSFGGVLTCHILDTMPDAKSRVKCVVFTDSVHSKPRANDPARKILSRESSCNWVASEEPLGTEQPSQGGIHCVSAGHPKHEHTTYAARPGFWPFLDRHLVA